MTIPAKLVCIGEEERAYRMSKTYRALGITAIAMLIALALNAVFLYWWDLRDFNATPAPGQSLAYLIILWSQTVLLIAPIISTFSLIVAAQSHDRAWIIIFLVTGIIGTYGVALDVLLPQVSGNLLLYAFRDLAPPGSHIAMDITQQVIFRAVPAVAALIYVALKLRADAATRGAIVAQA